MASDHRFAQFITRFGKCSLLPAEQRWAQSASVFSELVFLNDTILSIECSGGIKVKCDHRELLMWWGDDCEVHHQPRKVPLTCPKVSE